MTETNETITAWARETFGEPESVAAVAARAMQELAELVQKLCVDENHPGAREELADVRIVLAQVQVHLGFNESNVICSPSSNLEYACASMITLAGFISSLVVNEYQFRFHSLRATFSALAALEKQLGGSWADVEDKMEINRARRWATSGSGVGQHVERELCSCGSYMVRLRCPNCGQPGQP